MKFDQPKQEGEDEHEQNRLPKQESSGVSAQHETGETVPVASSVEAVEQKINKLPKERELELAIRGAPDFRGLNNVLLQAGGLQGNQRFYPAEDLMRLIAKVGQGQESPAVLTNTGGLRSKVVNLLRMQQLRDSLASDPREALMKKIGDLDLSISDTRMRLQSASASERDALEKKLAEREKQKADLAQQLPTQN